MTLERARSAGNDTNSPRPPKSDAPNATPKKCETAIPDDRRGYFEIAGVDDVDLRRMRDVYAATKPDPHLARDRSLHTDCMKANLNKGQMDIKKARRVCDCILVAMQSVPSAQLDAWMVLAQAGADVPMQQQPWFEELLPKLLACSAAEK